MTRWHMAEYSAESETLLMALASKAGAKKSSGGLRAAPMDPEQTYAGGGGLPDLFRGVVRSVRLRKWAAKEGSGFKDRLAAYLLIEPVDADDQPEDAILPEKHLEEHEGMVEARYSVGDLADWAPSEDGEEALDADNDEEGVYAVPTERMKDKLRKAGIDPDTEPALLNRGTNWMFLLQKFIDLKFDRKQMTPDVSFLEGTDAIWVRVPPPERSFANSASATGDGGGGQGSGGNKILVPSEIIEFPYKAAKGASAGKAASKSAASASKGKSASSSKAAAAKASENGAGELDAKMYEAIEEALREEDDNTLTLNAAKKVAVKALDSDEKKDGLARLTEDEFWADAANISLDDESGEVSLIG